MINKPTLLKAVMVFVAALLVGCSGTEAQLPVSDQEVYQPTANQEKTKEYAIEDSGNPYQDDQVLLRITRDYGIEEIITAAVSLDEGWSVYDVLIEAAEIETDYGGSFISGINGFTSSVKGDDGLRVDWFYYVNGICADVGALDYQLQPGDRVWWDLHSWQSGMGGNAAVTGQYPSTFTQGYGERSGDVTILFDEGYQEQAEILSEVLADQSAVIKALLPVENNENLLQERSGPTIVIGDWMVIGSLSFISDLNSAYEKNGQFHQYTEGGLTLMDALGSYKLTAEAGTGTVAAYGAGLGDANPLWVISGNDEVGTLAAIRLLTESWDDLTGTYSVAVTDGEVYPLPIPEE